MIKEILIDCKNQHFDEIIAQSLGQGYNIQNDITDLGPKKLDLIIYDHSPEKLDNNFNTIVMDYHNNYDGFEQVYFLQKPISIQNLSKLIKNLLTEQMEVPIIISNDHLLYPNNKKIIIQDKEIFLTEKEVAIIKYLYDKKEMVTKNEILEKIWKYNNTVDSHTLETHMYRLRQKLGEESNIIKTVPGGYIIENNL